MRLIFVRHGDPDYEHDALTERGRKEAEALRPRVAKWRNIAGVYVSPFGRAQETAEIAMGDREEAMTTFPWLREFSYKITDPITGTKHVPWDLMPEYYFTEPLLFDPERWYTHPLYRSNPEIEPRAKEAVNRFDALLSTFGYHRDSGGFYRVRTREEKSAISAGARAEYVQMQHPTDEDETLVFFCHLGISVLLISHILGLSPLPIWQGTYLAPTSVTVLNEERRIHDNATFRIQFLGDTAHLTAAGIPVSPSGVFGPILQEGDSK